MNWWLVLIWVCLIFLKCLNDPYETMFSFWVYYCLNNLDAVLRHIHNACFLIWSMDALCYSWPKYGTETMMHLILCIITFWYLFQNLYAVIAFQGRCKSKGVSAINWSSKGWNWEVGGNSFRFVCLVWWWVSNKGSLFFWFMSLIDHEPWPTKGLNNFGKVRRKSLALEQPLEYYSQILSSVFYEKARGWWFWWWKNRFMFR